MKKIVKIAWNIRQSTKKDWTEQVLKKTDKICQNKQNWYTNFSPLYHVRMVVHITHQSCGTRPDLVYASSAKFIKDWKFLDLKIDFWKWQQQCPLLSNDCFGKTLWPTGCERLPIESRAAIAMWCADIHSLAGERQMSLPSHHKICLVLITKRVQSRSDVTPVAPQNTFGADHQTANVC